MSTDERFVGDGRAVTVEVESYGRGFLVYEGPADKKALEQLTLVNRGLFLTQSRNDLRQGPRVVPDPAWDTFRDHTVLEYEIPKCDGHLVDPDVLALSSDRVRARNIRLLIVSSTQPVDCNA